MNVGGGGLIFSVFTVGSEYKVLFFPSFDTPISMDLHYQEHERVTDLSNK